MGDNATPDLTPFFPETKPEDIPVIISPIQPNPDQLI